MVSATSEVALIRTLWPALTGTLLPLGFTFPPETVTSRVTSATAAEVCEERDGLDGVGVGPADAGAVVVVAPLVVSVLLHPASSRTDRPAAVSRARLPWWGESIGGGSLSDKVR